MVRRHVGSKDGGAGGAFALERSAGSVKDELLNLLVQGRKPEGPHTSHHPHVDEVQPLVGAVE